MVKSTTPKTVRQPGVGRGGFVRELKDVTCQTCGALFQASRSDAKRCQDCTREWRKQTYPDKRIGQQGVGKGAYQRREWPFTCQDCGQAFTARRANVDRCEACAAERNRQRDLARNEIRGACARCGGDRGRRSTHCKRCAAFERAQIRERNPNWKGGRWLTNDGYVMIRVDGEYVREHDYIWEQAHGPIPDGWHVHHENENKADNRLENLRAMSAGDHMREHHHRRRIKRAIDSGWFNPKDGLSLARAARIRTLEARLAAAGLPID